MTKKEVLKRRDTGDDGLRSEYLVRKIIIPINVSTPKKGTHSIMIYLLLLLFPSVAIASDVAIIDSDVVTLHSSVSILYFWTIFQKNTFPSDLDCGRASGKILPKRVNQLCRNCGYRKRRSICGKSGSSPTKLTKLSPLIRYVLVRSVSPWFYIICLKCSSIINN